MIPYAVELPLIASRAASGVLGVILVIRREVDLQRDNEQGRVAHHVIINDIAHLS